MFVQRFGERMYAGGAVALVPPIARIVPYEIKFLVGNIDLSSRVRSWELRFEFDAGAWTLDIELTNPVQYILEGEGLAPWDPLSRYNQDRPLLGAYNPVSLSVRPEGSADWQLIFKGWVGPAGVDASETWGAGDTIRVTCVGPSQPLKDWMIEERLALRYTDAPLSKASWPNDLLNRIVLDQGFNVTIYYRDDPTYYVTEYIISGVSLWEALENALAPTGFRLVEWPEPEVGRMIITVVDPLRFKAVPDRVIVGGFSSRRISGNEADVRTFVGVVYRDRNDFQEKIVYAESPQEIVNLYGIPDGKGGRKHRKMIYRTSDRSLVDTESEARELATMILWDLETPTPNVEVTMPFLDFEFRPFQLVAFQSEAFESLIGIQGISWSWSWDRPIGQTQITGARGKVVGARNLWFTRDIKRGQNREWLMLEELRLPASSIPPSTPFATGSWFQHLDGSAKPVVDIILAEPPAWARRVVLKIYRLKLMDSATVNYASGSVVVLADRSYPENLFSGPFGDFLVPTSGPLAGRMLKINTVIGSSIYLERQLPGSIPNGAIVWIARVKRIETKTYPLVRFIRLEDVVENELIGVLYAWGQ